MLAGGAGVGWGGGACAPDGAAAAAASWEWAWAPNPHCQAPSPYTIRTRIYRIADHPACASAAALAKARGATTSQVSKRPAPSANNPHEAYFKKSMVQAIRSQTGGMALLPCVNELVQCVQHRRTRQWRRYTRQRYSNLLLKSARPRQSYGVS